MSDPHKAIGALLGGLQDYCDEHAARVKSIMDAMPCVRRDPVSAAVDPCRTCGGQGSVCEEVQGTDYSSPRLCYGPCCDCCGTGTKTVRLFQSVSA